MPSFRTGTVTRVLSERDGFQRVEVDGERAYVLTALTGPVETGDDVVINVTAVELGLGTGGWHVVHWNLSRREWSAPGGGHIMKLRYTSLQADTGAAEESLPDDAPFDLAGLPVVACALHSQVACVAVAFKHLAPDRRLVYVMTDGGALPLVLSDLVAQLRERGLIDAVVTAGNAFGGDLEAVNVFSGLQVAHQLAGADAVVAGIGPGVVGTGTGIGHTGLDVTLVVNAAAALGAHPIVAVRYSEADPRPRHQGVSHHTRTAVRLSRAEPEQPTPQTVPAVDVAALLASAGIGVTSMGRGPAEDPGFFAYAAAAGLRAAQRVTVTR